MKLCFSFLNGRKTDSTPIILWDGITCFASSLIIVVFYLNQIEKSKAKALYYISFQPSNVINWKGNYNRNSMENMKIKLPREELWMGSGRTKQCKLISCQHLATDQFITITNTSISITVHTNLFLMIIHFSKDLLRWEYIFQI